MRINFTLNFSFKICSCLMVGLLLYGNSLYSAGSPNRQRSPLAYGRNLHTPDSINISKVSMSPFISIQQLLKGNVAGVHVQENNGEPGTLQSMLIRGLSSPIFSNRDVGGVQPIVYVNGIPILTDNSFVYDVQQLDINPIGSATNLMAGLDINNIVSMEVIKDPLTLAKLGPLAANGAIWIVTKDGFTGDNFTVNASFGVAAPPMKANQTNASYERDFRNQFFDAYEIPAAQRKMPQWLSDDLNDSYFGNSDWAESYYRFAPQININASLAGGSSSANYIFMAGATSTGGVADATNFSKYNMDFFINMVPLKNMTVNFMISGNMLDRKRNKNFADRFAEMQLLPSLTTPISPNGMDYDQYLGYYNDVDDDNSNNIINSYLGLTYKAGGFTVGTKLLFNYSTNRRHAFFPTTLMESMNFVSDYAGYNRRTNWSSTADYAFKLNKDHKLNVGFDFSLMGDANYYTYTRGYDGDSDEHKTSSTGKFTNYYYRDKEIARLLSFSGLINYSYKNLFDLSVVLRSDGYSKVQSDNRWLFTPAFRAGLDLKRILLEESSVVSKLSLSASWARIGRLTESDRSSLGPQYTSEDLGWLGQSPFSSYNGFATITRSYSYGWTGYEIGWPYSEKAEVEINGSLLSGRLDFTLGIYNNDEKDLIVRTSVPREFGYHYQFMQGMNIRNRGFEIGLSGKILSDLNGFNWTLSGNMNFNRNKLLKLPGGLNELEYQGRKLQVGQSIDRFWVYENLGVYNSDAEVPTVNNVKMNMGHIPFTAGDPIWRNVNGDSEINDADKVLKAQAMPSVTGGITSTLTYKKFDLGIHFIFALGHSALNTRASQRYDFMNLDTENGIDAVREIFFWQNTDDRNDYPIYNPLSKLRPYRADQDMFLESLSYLKLRTLSLGYTLSLGKNKKSDTKKTDNVYVYVVGNNLFTITNFSGMDPELVDFTGSYRGYGVPPIKMVTIGARFKF